MKKIQLLFLVILIEGYVVLACELLAIRQLIPFVGSGTEVVSIIISAVLLPLAIGYHVGGNSFKRHFIGTQKSGKRHYSVRRILLKNILSAMGILSLGLSYIFIELFFGVLDYAGIHQRLMQTALYSALFLVLPVFLLGQTVPLISNYFSRARLSEITGKMLFFSTTGSFLGSVFSTIVLMTTIGVHNTVIVTIGLLCALTLLLARKFLAYESIFVLLLFAALFKLNSDETMASLHIVSDNAYNTVRIETDAHDGSKILKVNRSISSKLGKHGETYSVMHYINSNFIDPIASPTKNSAPRDILIIGAGGFTMGLNDAFNHYTYVDIDKALKQVAETHFLPAPLTPNKRFVANSARAFVHSTDERYDLIIVDTYTNIMSVPMETTSREFLLDVKKCLKSEGIVAVNMIADMTLRDRFALRYNNTFASVFPGYTRHLISTPEPWAKQVINGNVLYLYFNNAGSDDRTVYTDDKNTYSLDRN